MTDRQIFWTLVALVILVCFTLNGWALWLTVIPLDIGILYYWNKSDIARVKKHIEMGAEAGYAKGYTDAMAEVVRTVEEFEAKKNKKDGKSV